MINFVVEFSHSVANNLSKQWATVRLKVEDTSFPIPLFYECKTGSSLLAGAFRNSHRREFLVSLSNLCAENHFKLNHFQQIIFQRISSINQCIQNKSVALKTHIGFIFSTIFEIVSLYFSIISFVEMQNTWMNLFPGVSSK